MTNDRVAAAFGALSDPTRVAIVSELAEQAAVSPASPAVGFADLRRGVGVDDSGRFRYHLNQLRDTFVRRTDDGYALTLAGRRVASVVAGGLFDERTTVGPEPLDDDCPVCGDQLRVRYADGVVRVGCGDGSADAESDSADEEIDEIDTDADSASGETDTDEPTEHGHTAFVWTLPPSAVADRPLTAAVPLAVEQSRRAMALVADGVCPECYGTVAPRAVETNGEARITTSCEACSGHLDGRLVNVVFADPAFAVFCRDRGYDHAPPPWQLDADRLDEPGVPAGDYLTADGPVSVPVTTTPDDPPPDPDAVFARFAVSLDGDRFEATVGPTGRVLSTRVADEDADA